MDEPSSLIEAIASLAWPIIAVVAIVLLLPTLRRVVRDRPFSIKVGAFEMSAQEASESLLRQIDDLQDQLATVRRDLDGLREAPQPPRPAPAASPPASGSAAVLWVDDHPEHNAIEITRLTSLGFSVVTSRSTKEALDQLGSRPERFGVLITDIGRGFLGRTAGLDTIRQARGIGFGGTAIIYTTPAAAHDRAADAAAATAAITGSPAELVRLVQAAVAT